MTTVSARESSGRMGHTMASRGLRFQRHRPVSPFLRLAQELGYAKPKTARDNLRKPYRQVAISNRVLLDAGKPELVNDLMREIDASFGPPVVPPLLEAMHAEMLADSLEDLSQEEFRDKLRRGDATVQDAREFLRRSVEARTRAAELERATMEWIREQGEQA